MGMMRDPYLYPNTEVLKNKLGVIDNVKLNTIEAEYTSTRLKEIIEDPIKGNFDLDPFVPYARLYFSRFI